MQPEGQLERADRRQRGQEHALACQFGRQEVLVVLDVVTDEDHVSQSVQYVSRDLVEGRSDGDVLFEDAVDPGV